jgi:hypothetical protein
MEITLQPRPGAATRVAARIIARLLREKPNAALGPPRVRPRSYPSFMWEHRF